MTPERCREKALEIGADFAFDPSDEELKKHRGLNACFDFAGSPSKKASALTIRRARKIGNCRYCK